LHPSIIVKKVKHSVFDSFFISGIVIALLKKISFPSYSHLPGTRPAALIGLEHVSVAVILDKMMKRLGHVEVNDDGRLLSDVLGHIEEITQGVVHLVYVAFHINYAFFMIFG
jgi:hypothetical protein